MCLKEEDMMKANGKMCILLYLMIGMLLAGCGNKEEPQTEGYRIYYLDTENTRLVTQNCSRKKDTVKEEIKEVLAFLEDDPKEEEYSSVFVNGVSVDNWELNQTKLTLYFNEAYKGLDAASELLLRAAVVQSLVQISNVDYISFFVGGEPLKDQEGIEIGYMRTEDFVQNTGSSLHSYQTANLKLYFAGKNGDTLKAEEVRVRYNSNISIEKLIVEQLMKGPTAEGDKAVLPAEAKVLGVSVRDRVCYVNFDEGFLNMVDQVSPKATIYALVNSIIDGGETTQVQILVNGEAGITYQEAISLEKPFSRDEDIIEKEEE